MERPSACRMKARVIFSIFGIFAGVSVFFVFGFHYENWNTAVWGLTSGIFATVTLGVHICYLKEIWPSNAHMLKRLMLLGCFVQLAGVCGFVTYLTLAIVQHQGLIIEGPGYYLTCVWCFMTWKWGFYLFYCSRNYRRIYDTVYTILLKEEKRLDGQIYS